MTKKFNRETGSALALAWALILVPLSCHAVDGTSLEYGEGNKTKLVRAGAQWNWSHKWWESNGTHIGGYWDLSLARWHASRYKGIPGNTQNITVLGLTPVFRLQGNNGKGFYLEGGIGANLFSELYNNNDRRLSTSFQFGDHLGAGYVFSNNLDLGLKAQHFSNGGIKNPNSGVNFVILRVEYLL
ncbi:MAG TPA: acyloxyacyl hydrolase [Noviherbaspirillum sp.]|uniref:acyloxyacyl hydrolase n=1 Tax=Noviherbaspirillum sp. TaxID=1926288 RepID=UPI002B4839E4|nr:acyloxyacyl hydrolase [Noviherbaspirillum sp.]HJV84865.1 acyloxyacyl hydrolase [Noviherbaspirillum sp.]